VCGQRAHVVLIVDFWGGGGGGIAVAGLLLRQEVPFESLSGEGFGAGQTAVKIFALFLLFSFLG